MCSWVEVVIYGLFPVIMILTVVSSTEGVRKITAGHMMSLAWIGLWSILFAATNHLSLMHLRYKARALELATGVPFQLADASDATLTNEQVAIGCMVILVPSIAGVIIKLGQGGFMGIVDRMMIGSVSTGVVVGTNSTSGNASMGRAGFDTILINTISMNKYGGNIGLQGGGATIGRGNSSTVAMAANDTVALQQPQNWMLTQMNVDYRLKVGHNQEVHHIDITSTGDQLVRRHGGGSSLTDVKGHDTTRGQYQDTGVVATRKSGGGYDDRHSIGRNLDRDLHEDSRFRTAAGANGQPHTNLGVSRGDSSGGGTPGTGSADGAPDPCEEKRIVDAMKQGGANQQQIDQVLKNYRGGKGGAQPSGGLINAGLGYNGTKTYTAERGQDRGVDTARGNQEAACTRCTFAKRDSRTEWTGMGNQSAQNDRHGRDAILTNMDEVSRVRDVPDRREFGTGDRTNRSDSNSSTTRKDLMADPYLPEKVAACDNMTAMRFVNQSEDRIMDMAQDHVGGEGMVQQTTAISQQIFVGGKLPTTKDELEKQSTKDCAGIPQDAQDVHKKKVTQTDYGGTAPLKVGISAPSTIAESRGDVQDQLDPKNKGNILARAGALDGNVDAWASPDEAVGAGRADPVAVDEDDMIRGGKDTAQKAWDKPTGGDGTANGEKLNDSMK